MDQIAPQLELDNEGALPRDGRGRSCGCLRVPVCELSIQGIIAGTPRKQVKVKWKELLRHEGHLAT